MTKRKHHVIKHNNIVVFPGTVQALIREGHKFAENYQYEEAVASFEKAFMYEAGDEFALSAYAFALYEVKTMLKRNMYVNSSLRWEQHYMQK